MASVEGTAVAVLLPTAKEKAPKAKKATGGPKKSKASPSHPPYIEMVKEAIVSLKERTGSSQYAIAKFIEEKQKSHLPSNFKKLLLVQLKKFVAGGKLVKVKNSFKLPAVAKPAAATAKKPAPAANGPPKKKVATKPKSAGSAKPKGTPVKAKPVAKPKAAVKPKVKGRPAKAAKTATVTSLGKKAAVVAKAKRAPATTAKKPKSIKSPAKKAPAKKARRL